MVAAPAVKIPRARTCLAEIQTHPARHRDREPHRPTNRKPPRCAIPGSETAGMAIHAPCAYVVGGKNRPYVLPQASYTLYGGQKGPYEFLQASYPLCGVQHGTHELLGPSYTLCGGQKGPYEFLQAFYPLCGGQNGTDELLEPSYTLCGGQNGPNELMQTCTLFGGQNRPYVFCFFSDVKTACNLLYN